jgi:predicted  nucleic acid-binding Zn-ribbon protein
MNDKAMDEGGGSEVSEQLLVLADLDTAMAQLQHRREALLETSGLRGVESELTSLDAQQGAATARREDLAATQRDLEAQIGALTERRSALERRMYAATGSSARDLQAMSEEVAHVTQRRAELEELELAAMIDQEPVDAELARLRADITPLRGRAAELRQRVESESAQIDADLATASSNRAQAAATLPGPLADRYEALRARLRGAGAARLVGGRCDGCHLELPSAVVERIRALPAAEVETCEQCGRILVPV